MLLIRLILRGIRGRPGQSAVVLLLAAVAAATAAATPAYVSAAQQSLLSDAFTFRPDIANGARFETDAKDPESGEIEKVFTSIESSIAANPDLDPLTDRHRFARAEVALPDVRYPASSRLMYREGLCGHIDMVTGSCATEAGEVLISSRSAKAERLGVGDTVTAAIQHLAVPKTAKLTVAGIYEPRDPAAAHWGGQTPFRFGGVDSNEFYVDSLFTTAPEQVAAAAGAVGLGVDYLTDEKKVRLDTAPAFRASLLAYHKGRTVSKPGDGPAPVVRVQSTIATTIEDAGTEQDAVAASVPFVTVPVLLLSWFSLYLVVARLIEDRAPLLALAKLRGHGVAAVAGFGTGEAAVLIVAS
ncbi:MAG: hypothetical protein ACRD0P_11630, partial [Stackebrandtia sp.]